MKRQGCEIYIELRDLHDNEESYATDILIKERDKIQDKIYKKETIYYEVCDD